MAGTRWGGLCLVIGTALQHPPPAPRSASRNPGGTPAGVAAHVGRVLRRRKAMFESLMLWTGSRRNWRRFWDRTGDNVIRSPHRLLKHGVKQMAHRGFREGVRGSLILVAWLILGGCSSSKVPATPKCLLASECKNPLQCVQGYCVAACEESRDCPSGERCIGATQGNTCQPLETATCQYTSQCTTPLVCAFDQKCREGCLANIDCPTGQKCTSGSHLCADPTIDKNYNPVTNEF